MKNQREKQRFTPDMANNRLKTQPLQYPRTFRGHGVKVLTSMPAGRMVPISAIKLLREDQVRTGRVRLSFEMHETAEILMNAVNLSVKAYLVPYLAFERFNGMEDLNRSYAGQPYEEGGDVIPFFESQAFGDNEIYKSLGLHSKSDELVSTSIVEAYNIIWNFRATNRSLNIEHRSRLDGSLAPAFWKHNQFKNIVPDFDQAKVDGEVALNVSNSKMPVSGIAVQVGHTPSTTPYSHMRQSDGSKATMTNWYTSQVKFQGNSVTGYPEIFAELEADGITISLSNIDAAKKTAAFAKMRESYSGHNDDWLISLLMDGISIPNQALKHPILLAQKDTIFGMSKRYATDSGNLSESVVNGATFVDLNITVPKLPTGGVIIIVAEALPEQLFERQEDILLTTTELTDLPEAMRDTLDPEKVDIVKNSFVDVDHDTGNDVLGYAPLNYKWDVRTVRIGGRFYRPFVDASFDEDRQRIWASEVKNPKLSEDFYISTEVHTKPFSDQVSDPFECVAIGQFVIEGNTQFGPQLIESSDDYKKVASEIPQERIEKE